jgi:hypothetical protein
MIPEPATDPTRIPETSEKCETQPERVSTGIQFTEEEREVLTHLANSKRVEVRTLSEERKRKITSVLDGLHNGEKRLSLLRISKEVGTILQRDMGSLQISSDSDEERCGGGQGIGSFAVKAQAKIIRWDRRRSRLHARIQEWRPDCVADQWDCHNGDIQHDPPCVCRPFPSALRQIRSRIPVSHV